jgi:hypothetical protein
MVNPRRKRNNKREKTGRRGEGREGSYDIYIYT